MEDLFSQQFGQGAASPTDSIDELVNRNIQEVLRAAELEECSTGTSQGYTGLTGRTSSLKRTTSNNKPAPAINSTKPRDISQPVGSQSHSRPSGTQEHLGSSVLDVPGHAEATIRLHKARIKSLEDDYNKLTQTLADRDRALAEAHKELKTLKADQGNWSKEKKTLDAQVERLQRRVAELDAALTNKEMNAKETNKDAIRLERERRAAEADARARDVRLQRALDEVDRYKAMLQELRTQEREVKDVARTDFNKLAADNKKLERQRAELLVAFKKQLKLIDVLKRQKVHLEAARALQFSEAEFMQVLDMGNS